MAEPAKETQEPAPESAPAAPAEAAPAEAAPAEAAPEAATPEAAATEAAPPAAPAEAATAATDAAPETEAKEAAAAPAEAAAEKPAEKEASPAAEPPKKKKVVVVGGGFAGSHAAKLLEDVADVTLIDSKEFFEITWATLRALVEPAVAEKILIPHKSYLKKGAVVVGQATGVSEKAVLVGETSYPYDFLVLSTGSVPQEPSPSLEEKINFFKAENEKLKAATNILIVGGGPTGVELAGEIVTDFPDKKVTLVHGGPRLLEFIGEKAGVKALKWLQSKGVTVKFNEKIEDVSAAQWGSSGTFKTVSGEEIPTDYLAVAIGRTANAGWVGETFASAMDKGSIKVDPFLKVEGQEDVFAAGDVSSLSPKLGYLAVQQAICIAGNIKAVIEAEAKGKPVKALKKYPTPPNMCMVSLGRKNGVAQLPFGTFTGFLPTTLKSKDLFISKIRKDLKVA